MTSLKLAILGASGRMGQVCARLVEEAPDLILAAELDKADGLIDFSAPEATVAALLQVRSAKAFHIIGTTGLSEQDERAVADAAKDIPIVKAGNFSLGVNLLCLLTEKAAAALGPDFDIEVLEMHHRHKKDAPSGTALMLGAAAAKGRGARLEDLRRPAREGSTGPREEGSIGFAALRGGSVTGEHSVIFAGPSERLALSHSAEDRALFARGALAAARWAARAKPGLYTMRDVLAAKI